MEQVDLTDVRHPESEPASYEAPALTDLGTLTELTTQKDVGGADGTTFLGVDLGS